MLLRRTLFLAEKTLLDLIVLSAAFCLAFVIRFEGVLPSDFFRVMIFFLPYVLLLKVLFFAAAGLNRSPWRYTGLIEATCILLCLSAAGVLLAGWRLVPDFFFALCPPLRYDPVPLGVIMLDVFLGFLGTVGLRTATRLWCERRKRREWECVRQVPTLLIGAGRAGAMVAREIAARPDSGIRPVGFLDDDPGLRGMRVQGLRVPGTTAQARAVAQRHGARQALITIANSAGAAIRGIARACEEAGLPTKIIPPLHEIVGGKINLSKIRDVAIEDLLPRSPVRLDNQQIRGLVRGRVAMITGAGGSIGSELCREICQLEPAALLLVEQAKNSLFGIHLQLAQEYPRLRMVPCVADICDEERMRQLFGDYRPAAVFHAAAHKHVPMMEWNLGEAVKNNVLGTRALADLAHEHGAERFVMISTDKAVNPSSVMGVSKRVAEMYVQALAQRSRTRFLTVRFGNVLGSNGSVIPIFKEQIAQGGPVTVTHPEMRRFFMTIPEACQLVLQAASMGRGGEIFILDMGEPVKIVDLARDLIRLSGLSPDHDVEIRFTGIRPGEKLYEELFLNDETAEKTRHPRIFVGKTRPQNWQAVNRWLLEPGELAGADAACIRAKFKEIVPEYQYQAARSDPADGVWEDAARPAFESPADANPVVVTPLPGQV
jgi:FlaA1/EpsC-like NDP-sugar epimerase